MAHHIFQRWPQKYLTTQMLFCSVILPPHFPFKRWSLFLRLVGSGYLWLLWSILVRALKVLWQLMLLGNYLSYENCDSVRSPCCEQPKPHWEALENKMSHERREGGNKKHRGHQTFQQRCSKWVLQPFPL